MACIFMLVSVLLLGRFRQIRILGLFAPPKFIYFIFELLVCFKHGVPPYLAFVPSGTYMVASLPQGCSKNCLEKSVNFLTLTIYFRGIICNNILNSMILRAMVV